MVASTSSFQLGGRTQGLSVPRALRPTRLHAQQPNARTVLAVAAPASRATESQSPLPPDERTHKKKQYGDANFPTDAEGRTYHIGTKRGEVANRVLSVGSVKRASMIAEHLQPPGTMVGTPMDSVFEYTSYRGFTTFTGEYLGVPVSIVSTNMGMPNMDFVVRECRAVVDGQMAFLRLGTCGAIQPPAHLGNIIIASEGSVCVTRDPDAFMEDADGTPPYRLSRVCPSDPMLSSLLREEMEAVLGEDSVVTGMNASADSFYSSQGRVGSAFDDRNEDLLDMIVEKQPSAVSLEMETFHMLDLARCSKGSIIASGAALALAERHTNDFIDAAEYARLERLAGLAALRALSRANLDDDPTVDATFDPDTDYIWMPRTRDQE